MKKPFTFIIIDEPIDPSEERPELQRRPRPEGFLSQAILKPTELGPDLPFLAESFSKKE